MLFLAFLKVNQIFSRLILERHVARFALESKMYFLSFQMSPPPHLGTSQPTRSNSSSMQQISQHKRSLSFNHHLSYNQVQAQQQPMHQHPQPPAFMKPSSTPQHQLLSQRKEIVPISPSIKSAHAKSESTSCANNSHDTQSSLFR